jgi:hypothetical protein
MSDVGQAGAVILGAAKDLNIRGSPFRFSLDSSRILAVCAHKGKFLH